MIVAFASGKGGTGKTLLSTAFAQAQARLRAVVYVDADVEEPNGHLFLHPEGGGERRFSVPLPAQVVKPCSGCGACQRACAFHAILALKGRVMVFPELCHSCGACVLVCPEGALEERPHAIGALKESPGAPVQVSGLLDVGQARSTPLVEAAVAAGIAKRADLTVIDSPPGTSCPVMAAVRPADLVVLVTEPTPFGLHDLELAVQMCRAMGKAVAAVINRSDLGDDAVEAFLVRAGVPLLGRIPFERAIAESYAHGEVALEASPALRGVIEALARRLDGGAP
ncbi:MAG: ATP-binding protein [Pseudomonadota bacterium]